MRLVTNNYEGFLTASIKYPDARVRAEGNSIVFYTGIDKAIHTVKNCLHFSTQDLAQQGYAVAARLSKWKDQEPNWENFGTRNLLRLDLAEDQTPEDHSHNPDLTHLGNYLLSEDVMSILKKAKPHFFDEAGLIVTEVENVVAALAKARRYEHRVAMKEMGFSPETTYSGVSVSSSNNSLNREAPSFKELNPVFCGDVSEETFSAMMREFQERAVIRAEKREAYAQKRTVAATLARTDVMPSDDVISKDYLDGLFKEVDGMIVEISAWYNTSLEFGRNDTKREEFMKNFPAVAEKIRPTLSLFREEYTKYYESIGKAPQHRYFDGPGFADTLNRKINHLEDLYRQYKASEEASAATVVVKTNKGKRASASPSASATIAPAPTARPVLTAVPIPGIDVIQVAYDPARAVALNVLNILNDENIKNQYVEGIAEETIASLTSKVVRLYSGQTSAEFINPITKEKHQCSLTEKRALAHELKLLIDAVRARGINPYPWIEGDVAVLRVINDLKPLLQ